MNSLKLIFSITFFFLISACGGGSSSGTDPDVPEETVDPVDPVDPIDPEVGENIFFLPNRTAFDNNNDGVEDRVVTRVWVTDSDDFYVGLEEDDINGDGVVDYIESSEVNDLTEILRIDDNADGVWDEITTLEFEVTLTDVIPSRSVTVDSSGVIVKEVNYLLSDDRLTQTRLIREPGSSEIDREVTVSNDQDRVVLELIDIGNDGFIETEERTEYIIEGNIETTTTTIVEVDPIIGQWFPSITTQVNDFNDTGNSITINTLFFEIAEDESGVVLAGSTGLEYRFDQYGNLVETLSDLDGDGLFETRIVTTNTLNENNLTSLAMHDDFGDGSIEKTISRRYQAVDLTGLINGINQSIRQQDLIISSILGF